MLSAISRAKDIVHQAICVAQPAKTHYHFAEADKEQLSISIIEKYRTPRVAAGGNVVDRIWKLKSEGRAMDKDYAIKNAISRLDPLLL